MYGVDLAVWLQGRRYRSLLELIEELPSASRLNEAIQNDPEQAELIAALPESEEEWSPRLRDYDLTATLLREIRETLVTVVSVLIRVNGGRDPKVPALPVPVTEIHRARERLSQRQAESLIARLLPNT